MARSTYEDFIVNGMLGSGSYGKVFKVQRKVDGQYYAMKEIDLAGMSRKEQEECIKETRVLSILDSDFIIKYYDSFLEHGKLYIITEYAANGNLHDFIKQHAGQRFPEALIWKLFCQLLLGLNHMHRRKILHRDIKTLNVFLDVNCNVKLGDMGVAKIMSTQTCFAKTIVGTPYYLSPELCEDKPYNERSDVWALGVVLYECCLHRHPFSADNQGALILKILRGQYQPVTGYSPALCEMVKKCLTQNASRRPNTSKLLLQPLVRQKVLELGLCMPDPTALASAASEHKRTKSSEGGAAAQPPLASRQDQFNAGAAPAAHVIAHPTKAGTASAAPGVRSRVQSQGKIRVVGDMDNPPALPMLDTLPINRQDGGRQMNESKAFVFGGGAVPSKPHIQGDTLRITALRPPSASPEKSVAAPSQERASEVQVSISRVVSTSGELPDSPISEDPCLPQSCSPTTPPPLSTVGLEADWRVCTRRTQQNGEEEESVSGQYVNTAAQSASSVSSEFGVSVGAAQPGATVSSSGVKGGASVANSNGVSRAGGDASTAAAAAAAEQRASTSQRPGTATLKGIQQQSNSRPSTAANRPQPQAARPLTATANKDSSKHNNSTSKACPSSLSPQQQPLSAPQHHITAHTPSSDQHVLLLPPTSHSSPAAGSSWLPEQSFGQQYADQPQSHQPLHLAEEDMQHLEREVDHLSLALNGNAQGSGTDGSGEDETEENEEESRARNPYWNVREPGGDEGGHGGKESDELEDTASPSRGSQGEGESLSEEDTGGDTCEGESQGNGTSLQEGSGSVAEEGESFDEGEEEGIEGEYSEQGWTTEGEDEYSYDDDFEEMTDKEEGSNSQNATRRRSRRASNGVPWSAQSEATRLQHMHAAAMIQRSACLDLIGESAFEELYALLGSQPVNEASMRDLSRLVFKIIPYNKSEVIQMIYKLLYIESQLVESKAG